MSLSLLESFLVSDIMPICIFYKYSLQSVIYKQLLIIAHNKLATPQINQLINSISKMVSENSHTKCRKWKMFTFCVQTVLRLEPHMLKVSFATVQLLPELCLVQLIPYLSNARL